MDSRRNTLPKEDQIDFSNYLDENALNDDTEIDLEWKDAEDCYINEEQIENQLIDLLAETEELEKIDEIYYNVRNLETASKTENITLNEIQNKKQ